MVRSKRNRRFLVGRVVAALTMLVAVVASVAWQPSAAEAAPNDGAPLVFGAHPSPKPGESRVEAAKNLEASLGGELGAVRRYLLWEDSPNNDPLVDWTVEQGAIPHISLIPKRSNGESVAWADIASAAPGSQIDTELRRWANDIAGLGVPVWFTFNHEPETTHHLDKGSNVEFVAAWRHIIDTFEEVGVTNARYQWVMTAYAFFLPSGDRRAANKWYPGDNWVDDIGADPYNWTDCRPEINNRWRSLEEMMVDVLDFAAQRPDKGLVIAEFGSAEDPNDPGRKAEWVNEIRRLVNDPAWSQLHAVMAFNAEHPEPGTECEWWADSSPQTLAAYRGMLNDVAFGGDGPPPPPAPKGNAVCTAAVVNGKVELNWSGTDGNDVVRRNGKYLASSTAGNRFYSDSKPPAGTVSYAIRDWRGGVFKDLDCGSVVVGEPQGACSVAVDGLRVTVSWDASTSREVLRRNDAWLATPSAAATTFTSKANPGSYVYELRTWLPGGRFTDTPCGTAQVGANASQCGVVGNGSTAKITWSGFEGKVVIRRNGAWRASPAAAATEYSEKGLAAGKYGYVLREWLGGSSKDSPCGSLTVR